MKPDYDLIIVGAGPAGVATALFSAENGLKTLLLDKAKFPRDKTCGDALSTYSIKRLRELNLLDRFLNLPVVKIDHIIFSAPNHKMIRLRTTPPGYEGEICGYVCNRFDFDHFLLKSAQEKVDVWEASRVTDLIMSGKQVTGVVIENSDKTKIPLTARVVVGADGYSSTIARLTGCFDNDAKHWMVSVRGYYKGVSGLNSAIEMHYTKEVIPGYFWIFPSPGESANVGVCVPKIFVQKKGIHLKKLLNTILQNPDFADRFKYSEPVKTASGWTLPVGTKRRKIHGDGYLLVGDAAGLVDPFSGEGIGNALTSGKMAAECIAEIIRNNDLSAKAFSIYPERLWQKMSAEFSLSQKLITLTRYPALINYVINRADKSEFVANWLSGVVAETIPRDELTSVNTYLKLLVK